MYLYQLLKIELSELRANFRHDTERREELSFRSYVLGYALKDTKIAKRKDWRIWFTFSQLVGNNICDMYKFYSYLYNLEDPELIYIARDFLDLFDFLWITLCSVIPYAEHEPDEEAERVNKENDRLLKALREKFY